MWDDYTTGHNIIRLMDTSNAMKRHYGTLKHIDKAPNKRQRPKSAALHQKSKTASMITLQPRNKPRARPPSAVIKRHFEIGLENSRMFEAINKINSKYGPLAP